MRVKLKGHRPYTQVWVSDAAGENWMPVRQVPEPDDREDVLKMFEDERTRRLACFPTRFLRQLVTTGEGEILQGDL